MPDTTLVRLRSSLWRNMVRAQTAATQPFRSLRFGEQDTDGTIRSLQRALDILEFRSDRLPLELLPIQPQRRIAGVGIGSTPIPRHWGPYHIKFLKVIPHKKAQGNEFGAHFGPVTMQSITHFQDQAGLESDGIAGPMTLRRIDDILFFLESERGITF